MWSRWTTLVPALAVVVLALTWGRSLPGPALLVVAVVLAAAVLAAVHHAEDHLQRDPRAARRHLDAASAPA